MSPSQSNPSPTELAPRVIIGLLRSGQEVVFRARGRSMWPAIPSGSLVKVCPCPIFELKTRQIAAYERNGTVVLHRIIERISKPGVESILFRDDFLRGPPEPIAQSAILGRVQVISRRPLRLRRPQIVELWAVAGLLTSSVRAVFGQLKARRAWRSETKKNS